MKLNSDITDYAKEVEMWRHTLVSQRCQADSFVSPVQGNTAAACSKALAQGEGCVAPHPSVFVKEIPY